MQLTLTQRVPGAEGRVIELRTESAKVRTKANTARSGGTCTFSDTGVEIDEGRKVVYRYEKIGDEPALMSSNG